MSNMNLKEKVVLVIGGATGIGASCVAEFLRNNVKGVVIADAEDNEAFIKQLKDQYGNDKVIFIKTDMSDKYAIENAFQQTIENYNNIDILINSAAIFDEYQWEQVIQINLIATAQACQLAISTYFPKYKSSCDSYIVNIASIAGIIPAESAPHYTASKHGVVGLTRSYGINRTVIKNGICVMAICQGLTDMPLARRVNQSTVIYSEYLEESLSTLPMQKPEVVAKGLMTILQNPESGSIWLINANVLTKMELPTLGKLINFS